MQKFIKKYLRGLGLFLAVLFVAITIQNSSYLNIGKQSASVFDLVMATDARPTTGYAANYNIGWINFAATTTAGAEGRVYVSDNQLYGYAWGENIGWISMNCANTGTCGTSNYFVTQNNKDGILTGYAWGENIGWISFNCSNTSSCGTVDYSVNITTDGVSSNNLTGTAWGENIGWITFSVPAPNNVTTTWIKDRSRSVVTISTPENCTYTLSNWSTCINDQQTRTILSPENIASCSNQNTEPLIQSCTASTTIPVIATTTKEIASSTDIKITINPTSGSISIGETLKFTAEVTGTTTNNLVTWTLLPIELEVKDFYGTLTDTGLYTAPNHTVNVTVQARSQADNNKIATADVSVKLKYVIFDNYVYTRNQCPDTYSEDIANLQDRLTDEGYYNGLIGGFCGNSTMQAIKEYQKVNGLTENGILDEETRAKLNSIKKIEILPEVSTSTESLITEPEEVTTPPSLNNGGNNTGGGGGGSSNNTNTVSTTTETSLSGFITENIIVLGTTTEKVFLAAKQIFESPAGSVTTKLITTTGVVSAGVAVVAVNGFTVIDLLSLPFRLWGLLLSALGLKKRNRPWGTVYDSVTKQPIDPAYVTLNKVGTNEENTSITDLDGRYGFLVAPGKYTIIANKTNYIFPSQKLLGKTEDVLYSNLYFGQEIDTQGVGDIINKNVPLDPIKFDWNEFVKGEKKLMKYYSRREKIVKILTDWIFRIGLVVSLVSLFLVTAPYNYIILGLYIILLVLRKFGLRQKTLGSLTEKDGTPLSFAIIRVFSADLNVEITNKVADKIGRYFCLVNKGKYFIKVEKKNDDESYSLVYTSPAFEVKGGVINQTFVI